MEMTKNRLDVYVMEFDFNFVSIEEAVDIRNKSSENDLTMILPSNWRLKVVDGGIIYFELCGQIDFDKAKDILIENKKVVGDKYRILTNFFSAEIL